MAPNNPEEFTEVRHRRSSGGGRKQQRGKSSSDQRPNRASFHRRTSQCSAASGSPAAAGRGARRGHGGARRSVSTGSEGAAEESQDPSDEQRLDLGEEGLNTGLVLEMLILEALVNHPEQELFSATGGREQLRFAHPEGDLFTWLNVTREWVSRLQHGTVDTWYLEHGIQQPTLRMVEKQVESRRRFLSRKVGHSVSLSFGNDPQVSNELISAVILNRFHDRICVYQGHPTIGYKVLATGDSVFLHPSSSVHFLTSLPTYILHLDDPHPTTREVRAVMVLGDGVAMSLLEFNSATGADIKKTIKENVVKPCVFKDVGESLAMELEQIWNDPSNAGPDSLKGTLKFQCNDTPLLFERSAETVTMFALPDYHETIRRIITDEMERLRESFLDECFEVGFPDDKSSFRLLIGPGAANEKFLYEYDFRSVWIHETRAGALSREFVREEMGRFGKVVEVRVSDAVTREDSGVWGTVTFRDPDDVVKLLASTKAHDAAMLIELAPNETHNLQLERPKVSVDRSVKIQVKICRRPAKSKTAFLTIKGARDFGILLNTKSMSIGSERVTISPSPGKPGVAQVTGLSQIVEERDILEAVSRKVGIVPSRVHVDRPEPFQTTADDLQKFKTSLQRLVDKAVDASKVGVRVFMPSADDLYLRAELKFPRRRMAISTMDYIEGASVRGLPLQVADNPLNDPKVPIVVFKVEDDVFKSVESEIQKHLSRMPRDVEVKVTCAEEKRELKVFSCNLVEAEAAASRLEGVLSPLEVKVSRRRLELLTSEGGESVLRSTMEETGSYVEISRESRILKIYGTKSAAAKAKDAILQKCDAILQEDEPAAETAAAHKIPLGGADKPPTLMIEVMKDLEGLASRTGAQDLEVDIPTQTLRYSAGEEAHFSMQATIASLTDLIAESSPTVPVEPTEPVQNELEERECVACYCPTAEGSHYTLQACEHHYCKECIDTHVRLSLESKKFPITCVDCDQPICIRDMSVLARELPRGMWKVLKASADHYVQTRPKQFGYCHRPDCLGVIYKQPGAGAYSCPLCYVKVCPRCLNQYHGAESCEEFQNVTAFKLWFAGSQDRKKCPNCGMGIEKVDGCNRIQCTNCQRHICWRCLEHFAEMRLAYDHLNREHNGYN